MEVLGRKRTPCAAKGKISKGCPWHGRRAKTSAGQRGRLTGKNSGERQTVKALGAKGTWDTGKRGTMIRGRKCPVFPRVPS